jgi:hypothetical protein
MHAILRRAVSILVLTCAALTRTSEAAPPTFAFTPVFTAGAQDDAGQTMGGTEIRSLVAYAGRVFASNGYWEDAPAGGRSPGAQILVLDGPGRPWRVDRTFDDRLARGRRRHLAVSALAVARFGTGNTGTPLLAPVSLLLASTWDVTGTRTVFVRNERSADWIGTPLAHDPPTKDFLPQIRSFGMHRDSVTHADLVFAGDTSGVFAGAYDPSVPGSIRWNPTPELAAAGLAADRFSGLAGRLRISSFAEAGNHLFAAIGQQVWVRDDGATPRWRLLYTNPAPAYSQTGLRGLTAVTAPGKPTILLAAVEGQRSRIVRINPVTGEEATDLDLAGYLDSAWDTRVSYVIAAYNDMVPLPNHDLLLGLEAFIPPGAARPPGHTVLDVVHGLEGGGWFLLRHPNGSYELHKVTAQFPVIGDNLVSVRAAVASPFPAEPGAFYLGGYDANGTPAHNTGWIARGSVQ